MAPAGSSDAVIFAERREMFGGGEAVSEVVRAEWLIAERVIAETFAPAEGVERRAGADEGADAVMSLMMLTKTPSTLSDGGPSSQARHMLVKWRGLPYESSTWEAEAALRYVDGGTDALAAFAAANSAVEANDAAVANDRLRHEPKSPAADATAPFSKLEIQPAHIGGPGLALYPYQLEGLNWLRYAWHARRNVILADEMGLGARQRIAEIRRSDASPRHIPEIIARRQPSAQTASRRRAGKTITSVSLVASIVAEGTRGPFLVIAPLGTLPAWEREFKKWAGDLNAVCYHGTQASRRICRRTEFGFFGNLSGPFKPHVVVTSYEIALADQATLGKTRCAPAASQSPTPPRGRAHAFRQGRARDFRCARLAGGRSSSSMRGIASRRSRRSSSKRFECSTRARGSC